MYGSESLTFVDTVEGEDDLLQKWLSRRKRKHFSRKQSSSGDAVDADTNVDNIKNNMNADKENTRMGLWQM